MPVIHSTGGYSGEIFLSGKQMDIKSPFEAMNMGIGMVHQEFMLIPDFTICLLYTSIYTGTGSKSV